MGINISADSIHFASARLVSSELEQAYRREVLVERRRPTAILLAVIGLISLLAMIPDALVLRSSPGKQWFNHLLSLGFSSVSLTAAWLVGRCRTVRHLDLLLTGWWLGAIATVLAGNTSYPADSNLFVAFDVLIPVAIYLLFPIGLRTQFGLAVLFTLLDYLLVAGTHSVQPQEKAFAALAFISAHVIGLVSCWYLHTGRRRLFLLKRLEEEERRRAEKLLEEVRVLRGILPICSYCKSIRDDQGYWHDVDRYIASHTEADFSHGICPDCMARHFPEEHARMKAMKTRE